MHACSESHGYGIYRHGNELEYAAATTDCGRSQCSSTDTKHAGIVGGIMPRVSLAVGNVQFLVLEDVGSTFPATFIYLIKIPS